MDIFTHTRIQSFSSSYHYRWLLSPAPLHFWQVQSPWAAPWYGQKWNRPAQFVRPAISSCPLCASWAYRTRSGPGTGQQQQQHMTTKYGKTIMNKCNKIKLNNNASVCWSRCCWFCCCCCCCCPTNTQHITLCTCVRGLFKFIAATAAIAITTTAPTNNYLFCQSGNTHREFRRIQYV